MYEKIISISLLIIGLIHLVPITGVVGVDRLLGLYGVSINDTNLEILMRHRAILFGLLGLFFVYSAFNYEIQWLAFIAAFISIVSFFWLVFSIGNYNASIVKVVIADVVAFVFLLLGVSLYVIKYKIEK